MRRIKGGSVCAAVGALIAYFACTALAPVAARAQGQPLELVFGDSLTDPGNTFAFSQTNSVPPDFSLDAFLVPGAAYARGGHHLSNGATWIEQLAQPLGANRSVLPAFVGSNPFALITSIVNAPAQFGLTNVTDPCETPHAAPFTCQTPDDYLFWDGIHPTAAVHLIIAQTVGALLGL